MRNPFGLDQYPWIADVTQALLLLLLLCLLAAALSLVLRFLRSGGEEREQIKWLAFAVLILAGLGFSSFVIPGIISPLATSGADPLWENLLQQVA